MGARTPLYQTHVDLGAKLVDFAGWDMPLHYGSQLQEHKRVREHAGMFDVSHMAVHDIAGTQAQAYVKRLFAGPVDKLSQRGLALYGCLLNDQAGIIDDVILYDYGDGYRLVSNAGTRTRVRGWLQQHATEFPVELRPRDDLAMIAIQGPRAIALTLPLLPPALQTDAQSLARFSAAWDDVHFIARTGYTGEDGFEWILPAARATACWNSLLKAGVAAAGLGARDTLRLEAGMNLYGAEMDETITPLECGLAWTIDKTSPQPVFIGHDVLVKQRNAGVARKLVGLLLSGKGVLRAHQIVEVPGIGTGMTTSGGYAPTLDRAIALARVPAATLLGTEVNVEIRGQWQTARVVMPQFVQHGRSCLPKI
jgi:aminomethyltransferase